MRLLSQSQSPALPPKEKLLHWLDVAFAEALLLWTFVDRARVDWTIQRMELRRFGHEQGDQDKLALLYALLALGQRFDRTTLTDSGDRRLQGIHFLSAAQANSSILDCHRSLAAVQTIVCNVLFLKAAAAQTAAHTFLGVATSAAIRSKLHEPSPWLAKDESAFHIRTWLAIRALDGYVSLSLGVPRNIANIRRDIPYPEAAMSETHGTMDSAMHFEMLESTIQTVEQLLLGNDVRQSGAGCNVSELDMSTATASIAKFDNVWETPIDAMTTAQLLLEYVQCYAELTVHAPLLNHLGRMQSPGLNRNDTASSSTSKCIAAAVKAVRLAGTLQDLGELHEARCLTIEVLAFAAMTLIVLGASRTPEHAAASQERHALHRSMSLLASLSQHSSIAQQCLECIQPLYVALNSHTKRIACYDMPPLVHKTGNSRSEPPP